MPSRRSAWDCCGVGCLVSSGVLLVLPTRILMLGAQSHLLVEALYRRPTHRRPVLLPPATADCFANADREAPVEGEAPETSEAARALRLWRLLRLDGVILPEDPLGGALEALGVATPEGATGTASASPDHAGRPHLEPLAAVTTDRSPAEGWPRLHDAIARVVGELRGETSVVAAVPGPFTLAAGILARAETGGTPIADPIRVLAFLQREALLAELERMTDWVIAHLLEAVNRGAGVVILGEEAAAWLSPREFQDIALPLLSAIVEGFGARHAGIPVILRLPGGAGLLEIVAAELGVQAVWIDWRIDLLEARHWVGDRVALVGNLDPVALFGTPVAIEREVLHLLDAYGRWHGYVASLGGTPLQGTRHERIQFLIRKFQQLGQGYGALGRV